MSTIPHTVPTSKKHKNKSGNDNTLCISQQQYQQMQYQQMQYQQMQQQQQQQQQRQQQQQQQMKPHNMKNMKGEILHSMSVFPNEQTLHDQDGIIFMLLQKKTDDEIDKILSERNEQK